MTKQAIAPTQETGVTTSSEVAKQSIDVQDRIKAKLDELRADFHQLGADIRTANLEGARAKRDRIEGFKQALRDLLDAAKRADQEWK